LVICAETCAEAEALLADVEQRLTMKPRASELRNSTLAPVPGWRLPEDAALHALGTDPVSRGILGQGVLYPCQAIFLASSSTMVGNAQELRGRPVEAPFVIIDGEGVLVQESITRTQAAVLDGLMHVVQRLPASAPLRYLQPDEVDSLLTVDAYCYRQRVEENASAPVAV
jgi:hypothetical protein